jgi:2-polyprenyl-3-methyl-5-hydroxy-6-metoxy-1,4-benzoquinol methylase
MSITAVNTKACPVCKCEDFNDYMLGLLKCIGCGLIVSPLIWEESINENMEDEWFGIDYSNRRISYWVVWFESFNNRKTLFRIRKYSNGSKKFLDIGVGSGSLLKDAMNDGYQVMGCDLSAAISEDVRRRVGVPVHCGTIDTLTCDHGFDFIVLNHVLEHVQDPVGFLIEINKHLNASGVLHVACPNISCWQSIFRGWTSYEPYHLSYFNKHTLVDVLKRAGLFELSIITSDSFSGWFLVFTRTLFGYNKNGDVTKRPNDHLFGQGFVKDRNPLLENVYRISMLFFGILTWPLRKVQGYLGYGDELVCIATKRWVA